VDQEDTLMDTLTVEETIMLSALLRLPRTMSLAAKKKRVKDTMDELGIYHIAQTRIGSSETRGISGGEKRRVSIACELVTSPSILFLDEPTSGLGKHMITILSNHHLKPFKDSYNAYNVIECLVTLARNYNRTVVFTIHQPRSNIFALFDQLVLLSQGNLVYSGPAEEVVNHLNDIGHPCPVGFNIADYIVDLTMHAQSHTYTDAHEQAILDELASEQSSSPLRSVIGHVPRKLGNQSVRLLQDYMLYAPFGKRKHSADSSLTPTADRLGGTSPANSTVPHLASLPEYAPSASPITTGGDQTGQSPPTGGRTHLQDLFMGYQQSHIAQSIRAQVNAECVEEDPA
jgi:ABC-type multidrug transport system ATPase subunit